MSQVAGRNPKSQVPNPNQCPKAQAQGPNPNGRAGSSINGALRIRIWGLDIHWDLGFGAWDFRLPPPFFPLAHRRSIIPIMARQETPSPRITNRRALHDYFITHKIECGMVLVGSEVKSLRGGHAQLHEAFARIEGGELILH